MANATSLRDLLLIREANLAKIDVIPNNLGSALGLKNGDGDPAVLIFVDRKIHTNWLPNQHIIQKTFTGPGGLTCPVDVVEGSYYDKNWDLRLVHVDYGTRAPAIVTRKELLGQRVLKSDGRRRLLQKLHGWTEKVTPGAQLDYFDEDGKRFNGTLACFARDRAGKLGFITNEHIASYRGNQLRFPLKDGVVLGIVRELFDRKPDEDRFPGVLNSPDAYYHVDCAFADLDPGLDQSKIDYRLPILDAEDNIQMQELGDPLPLDLDTMGMVGKEVIGVGRTRSYQKGTVAAFAYRYLVQPDNNGNLEALAYDYLIIGEDDDDFSDPGDSGKLIVTDDGQFRPVGLLYAGSFSQLRHGRKQENWTDAIDINYILQLLDVSIVKH